MKQLLITKLQNKHECALQYIQNSNQFLSISIINLGITLDNIQLSSIQSLNGSWCMHMYLFLSKIQSVLCIIAIYNI